MKKAYLVIFFTALLLSPTSSKTDEAYFFKKNKYTKNIRMQDKNRINNAKIAFIQALTTIVVLSIAIGFTINKHHRYQSDFYNAHFNRGNRYNDSSEGETGFSYYHNQHQYNSSWQRESRSRHYHQDVIHPDNNRCDDSSEEENDFSYFNQPPLDNSFLEPDPECVNHNKEVQKKIDNMRFVDGVKNMINTPLDDSDDEGWALNQCMFSVQAIKKMNTYRFELDDKFADIDMMQGLGKLINLTQLKKFSDALDIIEGVLINGDDKQGFFGEEDRAEMHHKIKHMIYAFNRYPKDESTDIGNSLGAFFEVLNECKYAWEQVLNQLIDSLAKRCDCSACTKYRNIAPFSTSDVANNLYSALVQISMDIKDTAFKRALIINGDKEDEQQVHASNYYAKQMPKFGIAHKEDDQYMSNNGDKTKDLNKVKSDFLKLYKTELVKMVKDKLSYNSKNTSSDFQDKVTMWLRASLEEQVKKNPFDNDMVTKGTSKWVADFYSSLVWNDSYEVREQFVYFLLHTFGFICWDAERYIDHPKSKRSFTKASLTISTLNSLRNSIFPDKIKLVKECKEIDKIKEATAYQKNI